MLNSISDRELLSRIDKLRSVERETTVAILKHLNEIERRRLYLQLGYSSMFTYCVGHLRYSESAAGRRLQVARSLLQFPEIGLFLERGEVTVVTVSQIAGVLTKSTANELLEKIRGKTQSEVEAIASVLRPPVALRDRVQRVAVAAASVRSGESRVPVKPDANHSHCGSEETLNAVISKLHIQFLADESFMEKYREACALLSNRVPELSFETVFGELLNEFIERHSPRARTERREKRAAVRQAAVPEKPSRRAGGRSPIPARTRDAVFVRDQGQCTYVGAGGKRCDEKRRLHVDHIVPVAHGGTDELANLRLLCAQHNQLEADRLLGRGIMEPHRRRHPTT
jgi:5-methylcytosine-specific restriction endonuclease McrA